MAARLVGLIASRGDGLRAELLAHNALKGLVTALGAMDAVASAAGPLPVLLSQSSSKSITPTLDPST